MQLFVRRSQAAGLLGRQIFRLWVRFELTPEETQLMKRYNAYDAILSEGDRYRDLIWSLKIAGAPAIVLALIVFARGGLVLAVLALIVGYVVAAYLLYQQTREEIRVSDVLAGRFFRCRSVVTLIEQEDTMTRMAVVFRRFLEAMKNWGGEEIIAIEPDKVPRIELDERPHAAA